MSEPNYADSRLILDATDPNAPAANLWKPEDLAALLEHQLSASVVADMEYLGPLQMLATAQLADNAIPPIKSYADALLHEAPPIELLRLIKFFAQKLLRSPDSALPREIPMLLYNASILCARLHHNQRITRLPDDMLCQSAQQLAALPWMNQKMSELLRKGVARIHEEGSKAP